MNRGRRLSFFFLFSLLFISQLHAEEIEIKTALHVHSIITSGGRSLSDIAGRAKAENIDAVIMTDLLAENFEYGLAPFYWPKVRIYRNSITKYGADKYFSELAQTGRESNVLMIDGAVGTPFYYWSGSILPGPLVMNSRAKDILAIGLGDPGKYESLPVIGNGRSGFNPYNGDQHAAPYQKFIDDVKAKGGIAIWSHPGAKEYQSFDLKLLGQQVVLDTPDYGVDILATQNYQAFGVYAVELAQIDNIMQTPSTASPGGLWDKLLGEYCAGRRSEPVWAVGEVDYNGIEGGITRLSGILNIMKVPDKSREEILNAIRRGRLYVVTESRNTPGRLLKLQDFAVSDPLSAAGAGMGGTAETEAAPHVHIALQDSDGKGGPLRIMLLRDGEMIKQWNAQLPFSIDFVDNAPWPAGARKVAYRLIAVTPEAANLLSNPVFARRK